MWQQANDLWTRRYDTDLPTSEGAVVGAGLANFTQADGKPDAAILQLRHPVEQHSDFRRGEPEGCLFPSQLIGDAGASQYFEFGQISGSISASTPACHAGERGSTPRQRDSFLFSFFCVPQSKLASTVSLAIQTVARPESTHKFGRTL